MVYVIEIDEDNKETVESKLQELEPSRLKIRALASKTLEEYDERIHYDMTLGAF